MISDGVAPPLARDVKGHWLTRTNTCILCSGGVDVTIICPRILRCTPSVVVLDGGRLAVTATWFQRFGDIPGISYVAPADVDWSALPRRGAAPEVRTYDDGVTLWWRTSGGGTTRSPAADRSLSDFRDATVSQIKINVAESLELPGEPADYHFILQGGAGELYARRRSNPAAIGDAHGLYLLDLQLLRALPDTIAFTREGGTSHYQVAAFSRLLRLYLTEGRVTDAAEIAELADQFGAGGTRDADQARARATAVVAEDGPG